ncbi:class I adenylate-forming enzyme family protein [Sphingosinithalassobacter portus]|uniref:class I adenylate-forming enzyme family protein n=1 Tax=Stakelama portus TaxID=2676234 RepID=UPI000D6DCE42|nr:AMP-binding protein [Sphingosinithalassobacter portus]
MNIAVLLKNSARSFAGRPAISLGTELYATYGEFGERAARLAAAFGAQGLARGDRVGIAMGNAPEYLEIMFGIWHAGLCAVPMNAKLHPREISYALTNSGARWFFTSDDLAGKLASLTDDVPSLERIVIAGSDEYRALFDTPPMEMADAEDLDPAWIFYTSGTTGRPKGATLTHRSLRGMMLRYLSDVDSLTEYDCMLHVAPLSHASGLESLPHIAKASHHVIPKSGGFDAAEIADLTHHYENMMFFAVPTIVGRLVNDPAFANANLDAIKTIFYGGAPMYFEDLKLALAKFGPKLVGGYGQGEAPCAISVLPKHLHANVDNPRYEEQLSSVGTAFTGTEFRIVDEDGKDLPAGEIGEIVVRSDVCMAGYWENPEATAKALRDGWLYTGDVGCVSEDGYLSLKDRSKDLIISGGMNIYPREIEEVLLLHPAVFEVSVVGRPHPEWGEDVVAFIVAKPEQSVERDELDQICLDNIARFKRPKDYFFIEELPKSDYGKILKRELRKRFE